MSCRGKPIEFIYFWHGIIFRLSSRMRYLYGKEIRKNGVIYHSFIRCISFGVYYCDCLYISREMFGDTRELFRSLKNKGRQVRDVSVVSAKKKIRITFILVH